MAANPCGGVPYEVDDRGLYLVDGEPVLVQGKLAEYARQTAANFGDLFADTASKYEIPVEWMIGIATMETGFLSGDPVAQAEAVGGDGEYGIMQLMPDTVRLVNVEPTDRLFEPEHNIDTAGKVIRRLLDLTSAHDLVTLTSVYNSGTYCRPTKCRQPPNRWGTCAVPGYTDTAVGASNLAVLEGLGAPSGFLSRMSAAKVLAIAAGVGLVGAVVYDAVDDGRINLSWLRR